MPEPIKVDFRRRRAKKPSSLKPAAKPVPTRGRGPQEPMVNWRKVPRFLLIVVPLLLALAALQWLIAR